MVKEILLGLAVLVLAIQFIRQPKNLGPAPSPFDIQVRHPITPELRHLLETACYDCHSNHTNYPWYAEVQPVGWWLASHISEGKEHLNFSNFDKLAPKRAAQKLEQCSDEVTDGGMPITSYKIVHAGARLTDDQRKALANWFDSVRAQIPFDPAQ